MITSSKYGWILEATVGGLLSCAFVALVLPLHGTLLALQTVAGLLGIVED